MFTEPEGLAIRMVRSHFKLFIGHCATKYMIRAEIFDLIEA